jgi:hypothetical protein
MTLVSFAIWNYCRYNAARAREREKFFSISSLTLVSTYTTR